MHKHRSKPYKTVKEVSTRIIERLTFAPSLTVLTVKADGRERGYCRDIDLDHLSIPLATASAAFRSLTSLSVPEIPLLPSALSHLASIASLQDAEIYIRSRDFDWGCLPTNTACATAFMLLHCLSIRSDSLECVIALLRAFAFPFLEEIVVQVEDLVYDILFKSFAQELASRPFARERMTTIDLRLGQLSNEPLNEAVPIYLRAELAPLFALSALQALSIRGHCHVILDDAALDDVSRAWPGITALYLEPARRSKDALVIRLHNPAWPPATMTGLLCIAEQCHQLRSLGLVLDLDTLPSTSELRRARARLTARGTPCPLRNFAVGWSRLGDHIRLASTLSAWFPALTEIWDSRDTPVFSEEVWQSIEGRPAGYKASYENEDIHFRWQEAAKLIPGFAKVRAQERDAERSVRKHADAFCGVALDCA